MYCKNCGTDIGNLSRCPHCGTEAGIPEYNAEVVGGAQNTAYSRVTCPKCGGHNCQPMTETNVTGGGYNAGNGCCGYLLFGPLGLLCGACGSGTTTTHRTYWICRDCGRRFNG